MPTPQQTLHLRAFRASLRTAGQDFTYGSPAVEFTAVESPIEPDDPRMEGVTDRHVDLVAETADMPAAPRLRRGDEITGPGGTYRVSRVDAEPASGLTHIMATAPTLAASASSSAASVS